ncbi:MAG: phosphoribosylformylglycinamidine synthase subunit PurQ [Candidatus Cyclonatronum sp.]|uniref:phosphoribosylformylglycinamidine synthase subunit PurQ n=1 Tax=Cyclonatronum sp. TaxID=3024185 RepID=UPI0025BDDE8D|nr:phosphoribosylformylglycinamidine synthase subunit PurQ [Cyclonatronum sp.]MCC5933524.1 phosphoribosylformylglycinamidine synthase subunit PurQ [Balneolales bacterium]MCH8486522.1 phosphoribosylformylglycinamidine synthase subunit PurQ [Cyclonatronum sp.]
MATFSVLVFPGSNCDHDAYHALKHVLAADVRFVWHKETSLGKTDAVIVPGGFSYGDYLRSGAIARFSPVMQDVVKFANKGGLVIGICNGFQILLEAGLLPGAMLANENLKFRCKQLYLRTEQTDTPFSSLIEPGRALQIPIAHGEGNYTAPPETLKTLEENGQVVFRYCTALGDVVPEANPNGSLNNIAGIVNKDRNVLGMMPHPERACETELGSTDGRLIFESMLNHLQPA